MSLDQRLYLQKNKGRWSEEECQRFEDAFFTYGSNWKLIARAVGSRSLIQIRSHAQKVVQKLQERGPAPPKPQNERPEIKSDLKQTPENPIRKIQENSKLYETWLYHTIKAAQILKYMKEQDQTSSAEVLPSAEESAKSRNYPESN